MSVTMDRRSIKRKAAAIGLWTMLSRVLGIARSFLQLEYLGFTGMSDAFLVAYRIPNFLRKIFAEGALSAAFVPVIVRLIKNDERSLAHSLMSWALLVSQGLLFFLTLVAWLQPQWMIGLIAPGFALEQLGVASSLVRILFPLVLLVSSAALLGGALQAVNCFTPGAFGPVLLNIVYMVGLIWCTTYRLSPIALAWFIIAGGVLHVGMHWYFYWRHAFAFGALTRRALPLLKQVAINFAPALLGMSAIELNMVIDGMFGSYLPTGTITMLHYGNRFMGIPLGIFGVAFATVLLSHFSEKSQNTRRRFGYYLLEAAQLIIWLMLPATLIMWYAGTPLFAWFLAGKASAATIATAGRVLGVYATGLILFCLNKVAMSMAYSFGNRWIPAVATIGSVLLNVVGNTCAVWYQSPVGIAVATILSVGLFFSITALTLLTRWYGVSLYIGRLLRRMPRLALHGVVCFSGFVLLQKAAMIVLMPLLIALVTPVSAYWFVTTPLIVLFVTVQYTTRHIAGIRLYFAP